MKRNTQLTFAYYIRFVRKYAWLSFGVFFGITVAVLCNMGSPIVIKEFVDALAGKDAAVLWHLLIIFLILETVAHIFWRVSAYSASVLEPRAMNDIAEDCFEHLHRHSLRFFNDEFVGSLVKRVNRMVQSFESIMDQVAYEFYSLVLRILIVIGVLFWLKPSLGLFVLVWTVIFACGHYKISQYKLDKYDIPKTHADTRITGGLADTVSNASTIKLFAALDEEKQRFHGLTKDWYQKTIKAWVFNQHVETVQGFFMIILNAVIFYIAIQLWKVGQLSVGDFVLIQSYLLVLFQHLWDLGRHLRHFYSYLADAEEMTVILNTPFEVVDKQGAKELRVNKGKVEFKKVSFSYTEDEEASVLRNFSIEVKASERIALIGPSGGGKTTITKLLLRLFDLDKGCICIDGQDISKVTQDSLRRNIALVPQDPSLFHRSLMENIRYGNLEASDEEVMKAAKLAHCHEFISKLPKAYDTFVGERGVKLSGGERQRVAIARAILADTKILILDEATSSLDSESEKLIKDALKVLMKGKTVFVIAHRLSTIVDMDRILVLEAGKIIEEGDHEDLVEKQGGLYKRLWDLQVGGYLE